MKRCIPGVTQNANESIHSKLYVRLPKTKYWGEKSVRAMVQMTALEHNIGSEARKRVMKKMGLKYGRMTEKLMQKRDTNTANESNEYRNNAEKKKQAAKEKRKQQLIDLKSDTYGAGTADDY